MYYDDGFDEEVEDALDRYNKKFEEDFPLMEFEGNKKKLIKTINKCIKKNKEYFVKYEDDEWD